MDKGSIERGSQHASPCFCLGESELICHLAEQIILAGSSDASVFIVGESGTGKEMVARAIHDASPRREMPFVAVNCGAINAQLAHAELFGHEKGSFTGALAQSAGYFESASAGTLFLDEVTEMSQDMQVHFLRVLESGTYQRVGGSDLLHADVRIISATNRDPMEAVQEGHMRQDFLHRLLVIPLRVPPLRERPEDVGPLARKFLNELNQSYGTHKRFAPRFLAVLAQHDWPGNVRELRNVVQCRFIMSDDIIDVDGLRQAVIRPATRHEDSLTFPIGTPLEQAQREFILATLAHHHDDKSAAAEALGISLRTLTNRLGGYDHDEDPSSP